MSDSLRHLPSLMFSAKKAEELPDDTQYTFLLRNYYYDKGRLIPRSWVNGCPPIYESK